MELTWSSSVFVHDCDDFHTSSTFAVSSPCYICGSRCLWKSAQYQLGWRRCCKYIKPAASFNLSQTQFALGVRNNTTSLQQRHRLSIGIKVYRRHSRSCILIVYIFTSGFRRSIRNTKNVLIVVSKL